MWCNHTPHRHKHVKCSLNGFCRLDSLGQFFTSGVKISSEAVCAASSQTADTKSKFTLINFFNRPLIWSGHAGQLQTKPTGVYYKSLSLSLALLKKKKKSAALLALCCFYMHLLSLRGSAVLWLHAGVVAHWGKGWNRLTEPDLADRTRLTTSDITSPRLIYRRQESQLQQQVNTASWSDDGSHVKTNFAPFGMWQSLGLYFLSFSSTLMILAAWYWPGCAWLFLTVHSLVW